jgi:hypothetical protein
MISQLVTSKGDVTIPDPPLARILFSTTKFAWLWAIVRIYLGMIASHGLKDHRHHGSMGARCKAFETRSRYPRRATDRRIVSLVHQFSTTSETAGSRRWWPMEF